MDRTLHMYKLLKIQKSTSASGHNAQSQNWFYWFKVTVQLVPNRIQSERFIFER